MRPSLNFKGQTPFLIKYDSFAGDVLQKGMTTTKTANKKGPSAEVEEIMKKRLELEYDFYYFVKDRFRRLKAELGLRTAA